MQPRNGALRSRHKVGVTESWRVVVRNDDVNMASTVAYLLHRICGMALPDAVRAMWRVQVDGSAEVGRFSGPDEAEQLAARLQSHGLHGQVRRAS